MTLDSDRPGLIPALTPLAASVSSHKLPQFPHLGHGWFQGARCIQQVVNKCWVSFPFVPEGLGVPEGLWVKDSSAGGGGGGAGRQRPFLISTPEFQEFAEGSAGPGGQTLTQTEPDRARGPGLRTGSCAQDCLWWEAC